MNCIVIEDQPPAQRILKKYIGEVDFLELKSTFSNAIDAKEYLASYEVDLIFLDIHLPQISGLDFLASLTNPPNVILTTAFSEYALQSYEFNVVDYLLKPFSYQRFLKAVSKVNDQKIIYVKSGYDQIKVILEDLFFIKSDDDYTEFTTANRKILSSESLRFWSEELRNDRFARIHKSYIINLHKIEKISGNKVHLEGDRVIPIGRAYKDDFINQIK